MSKRILALLLCAVMLIPCLAACQKKDKDDQGPYITMYLSDNVYDFDPANAYTNKDTLNVVSLMFDTLFTVNNNGKVKGSLVDKYKVKENPEAGEYFMELKLNEAYWSNNIRLSADDVVFAWKRLLNSSNNFAAASLLFDIKNARAVKNGNVSIDDLGLEAVAINVVKVSFEAPINYDQFLLNLTSVATAPLLESYVTKNLDWAKKPSMIVTSGPFKLGKLFYDTVTDENGKTQYEKDDYALDKDQKYVPGSKMKDFAMQDVVYFYLERNTYYDRDVKRDAIDKSVKPYRILVDCTKSDEQLLEAYKNGEIFYIGEIPVSLRGDSLVKKKAEVSNALTTLTLFLNEKALIADGTKEGSALFASKEVRQALSLAIDRDAIATALVYAEAASGFVCPGVFNEEKVTLFSRKDFRKVGGDLIATSPKVAEAQQLLATAEIDPTKYSFTIKVASYDDENVLATEMVAEAWRALGFTVTVHPVTPIANNDHYKDIDSTPTDVCDDIINEAIWRGNYEVIAFDYVAFSANASSMLENFANDFSGMALVKQEDGSYKLNGHSTGYYSEDYNTIIEAVYYLPYFANLTEDSTTFINNYQTPEEYKAVYNKVKAVYEKYGITPSGDEDDWAEQESILLHKAEELLLEDMPIIPVVFKKDAVLISKELKNVKSNYYVPATFQKTKLKKYEKYVAALEDFPNVDWTKVED